MSKRFNNGSHYENHPRAEELHELAEHNHETGERHDKQEHLTGTEHTRQGQEHNGKPETQNPTATVGHGVAAFTHADTAVLAHQLWESRGRPEGTSLKDWLEAARELRGRGEDLHRNMHGRGAGA